MAEGKEFRTDRKLQNVSSVPWMNSDEEEDTGTLDPPKHFRKYGRSPIRKDRDWTLDDSDSDQEDVNIVTNLKWDSKGRKNATLREGFTGVRGGSRSNISSANAESTKDKQVTNGSPSRMPKGPPPMKSVFANIASFKEISRANREDPPARREATSEANRRMEVDDTINDDYCKDSSSDEGIEEMGEMNGFDDDSEDGIERSIEVGDDAIEDAEKTVEALMSSETAGRRSGRYIQKGKKNSDRKDEGELTNEDMGIVENTNIPFISVAHESWARREHVQCVIIRHEASIKNFYYPTYELILESCNRTLIVAKKLRMNRTSNYHLFDMTRGIPGTTLNKKSCNYIGKLRGLNSSGTEYSIVSNNFEGCELGGIQFFRQTVVAHITEGSVPRKMRVAVPVVDKSNIPIPFSTKEGNLVKKLSEDDIVNGELIFLQSKLPVYQDGNYRLNFRGRVNQASVKNFQLTTENDIDDVVLLFGKVGVHRFHLDFKAPLNSIQAFCMALAQFNL